MTTDRGFGRGKTQWLAWLPLIAVLAGWLLTWGGTLQMAKSTAEETAENKREIGEIKRDFVTGREFRGINDRLGRIEGKLDNIDGYFRRPVP